MWLQSRLLMAEIVAPLGVIILASGLFYGNITLPRRIFNRLHDKVSNRDVARLRKDAADPLKILRRNFGRYEIASANRKDAGTKHPSFSLRFG